jgi:hypothetical protein
LGELAGKPDFAEITDPVDLLQAMVDDQSTAPGPEDVEGRVEKLKIGGYPSAAVDLSLTSEGNSAKGRFAIILVEKRVVIAWATCSSDEWETFRPTFATMLRSLTFFEPQGGHWDQPDDRDLSGLKPGSIKIVYSSIAGLAFLTNKGGCCERLIA